MTVYLLRYADDGSQSHINEAFSSISAYSKRLTELKKEVGQLVKSAKEQNEPDPSSSHVLQYTAKDARKVIVKNQNDLIRLINSL